MFIEPRLKPLYANLKRLSIGEYLETREFKLFALESGIDHIWSACEKEVSSKRRVIMLGFHNPEDDEEALMYFMSWWFSKQPETFQAFILPLLYNFDEWNPEESRYDRVIECLKILGIKSAGLEEFEKDINDSTIVKARKKSAQTNGRNASLDAAGQLQATALPLPTLSTEMSFSLSQCPLTGLPLDERATYTPVDDSASVLYSFSPIGSALFGFHYFLALVHLIKAGTHKFRPDLAGICRASAERGQDPPTLTAMMFSEPLAGAPLSFEDKRSYFLHLLYDVWGKEHRKKTLNTFDDFPLASASSAEEFYRLIESLLDDGLIRYDDKSVVHGDWKNGIQAHYHNVLLTPAGKRAVFPQPSESPKMASNLFNFGDGAKVNLVQGPGAIQTNVSGDNANANVTKGNNNTQSNQVSQPANLPELVEALKQALSSTSFDSYRDEIDHEIHGIELQLKKTEPKKSILERSFDYIKDMAIKSAGPAAAAGVVELVKHAPALLAAAQHLA